MDSTTVLAFLTGVVLPLLTSFVTKESWPENLKAVLLAALSAAASVAGAYLTWPHPTWQHIAAGGVLTFVTAVGVEMGFWAPVGVKGRLVRTGVADR